MIFRILCLICEIKSHAAPDVFISGEKTSDISRPLSIDHFVGLNIMILKGKRVEYLASESHTHLVGRKPRLRHITVVIALAAPQSDASA